jgi:hypothetical protein
MLKYLILIFSVPNLVQAQAQPVGQKYSFKEIGWSITLPGDFSAFPSADQSIQIQPGRKPDDPPTTKRLIMAMKDANAFDVNLSSCDVLSDETSARFSASTKRSYEMMSKQEGTKCDSATTTVLIDEVPFRRFQVTIKRNNVVQETYEALYNCYKGYGIYITLLYSNKKIGDELESMLERSKFSK